MEIAINLTGGIHRRGMTKSERALGYRVSCTVPQMLYEIWDGDDRVQMTKRQANKAFGSRQVRRALRRRHHP